MSTAFDTECNKSEPNVIPPVVLPRSNISTKSADLRSSAKRKADRTKSFDDVLNVNNQNNSDLLINELNNLGMTNHPINLIPFDGLDSTLGKSIGKYAYKSNST